MANYTSVESKFDVMIKKTSKVESEEYHHHNRKISGLAALDDDESGEERDAFG